MIDYIVFAYTAFGSGNLLLALVYLISGILAIHKAQYNWGRGSLWFSDIGRPMPISVLKTDTKVFVVLGILLAVTAPLLPLWVAIALVAGFKKD